MRFVWIVIIFVVLVPFSAADARQIIPEFLPDPSQELPLEGNELRAIFTDRTHRGYYQYEDWETREPAFTERMNADGSAIHVQDGITSIGTWRARHNVVCFEYDDMTGGCFNIYKKGTCYFAIAAMTDQIIAITVLDDDVADCEPSFA
ncbi:MAG: hypothetical protein AAFP97_05230 [Pseudomonadota bacterium]